MRPECALEIKVLNMPTELESTYSQADILSSVGDGRAGDRQRPARPSEDWKMVP
jgi:hypothetical protein